jgi:AmiR/NasT family two-component response regulator
VHREIGVAIGILMAAGELGVDEAFTKLHSASRRLHRDLQGVARHVTASGQLPDEPGDPQP